MQELNNRGVLLLDQVLYQQATECLSQAIRSAKEEVHTCTTSTSITAPRKESSPDQRWMLVQKALVGNTSSCPCQSRRVRGVLLPPASSGVLSLHRETDLQIRSAIAVYNLALTFLVLSSQDNTSRGWKLQAKSAALFANARRLLEQVACDDKHVLAAHDPARCLVDFVRLAILHATECHDQVIRLAQAMQCCYYWPECTCDLREIVEHIAADSKIASLLSITSAAAA